MIFLLCLYVYSILAPGSYSLSVNIFITCFILAISISYVAAKNILV